MMAVRRLVRKYGLTWDENEIIPQDAGLVERVFQVALELAQAAGVYYQSTGTIIPFEKGEIEHALQGMTSELIMGEGKDMRTLFPRQIMDTRPPLVWAGNPGTPTPQDLFLPMVISWMQEPLVDRHLWFINAHQRL